MRFLENTYFVFEYRVLCKQGDLENPTQFMAKFM